jgi:hypothetical protein
MTIISYIDDDKEAASGFLSKINRKALKSRFSESSVWEPDFISLALADGVPVAMADAVVLGDNEALNAGLLAKPGYGAYAVKALLHLKSRIDIPHWQSTLRVPTDATITISRRHFTQTYDQATSELASKMVEIYGQHNYLHPIPLVASDEFLRMASLPALRAWDEGTKLQLLKTAAISAGIALRTPSGTVLPMQDVAALSFDLLKVPYDVRQQFSRMMITSIAAMHGHDPSPLIGRILKPGGGSEFMTAVRHYADADISGGGAFTVEHLGSGPINLA